MAQMQQQLAAAGPASFEQEVVVPNPQGLHARPAVMIAKVASGYKSQIRLRRGNVAVDAKSTLKVLELAAPIGTRLVFSARGADAQQAVEALVALVERGFDEM